MKRLLLAFVATLALAVAGPAAAATPTLFGSATVQGDSVKLVSDFSTVTTTDDFGGVAFTVPAGTTFASLTNLSATFNTTDDSCGGGSPRFQIALASGKNVMVHVGPSPSFTGCALNVWLDTGNLIGNNDAGRYEITPGSPSLTYAQTLALVGSEVVTGISFVADGGWFFSDKEQTVLVRSVTINSQTYRLGESTGGNGKANPGQICKNMRDRMGREAFNELWGTNANSQNGMGKCASAIAHARNAGKTHEQIMDALAACIAQGKKGAALGACVAANDGVAATATEAQEAKQAKAKKAKGKSAKASQGRGNGRGNGKARGRR